METGYRLIYVADIFLLALIAGLFYAFTVSVNPGLAALRDREYLAAMKSINRAILNPWFFISFMGAPLAGALAVWVTYAREGTSETFWFLLAALLIYIGGTFLVTIAGNVPLNNSLAAFDVQAATNDGVSKMREVFERPWNRYHAIRTAANLVSLALSLFAFMR